MNTKFEPLPLLEIIRENYVPPSAPPDAPARVVHELAGDAALAERRYEDALSSYKAAKSTSWRLKSKMGLCFFQLERWAEGAKALEEAPRRKETVPLIMLIDCVERADTREFPNRERIRELIRILMEQPEQPLYSYDLVYRFISEAGERVKYFKEGYARFPSDANMRRRYMQALWLSRAAGDELVGLMVSSTSGEDAAPEDLWLASEIASSLGHFSDGLTYLRRLGARTTGATLQVVRLAEADLCLQTCAWRRGTEIYREVFSVCTAASALAEVALAAARGLVCIGDRTGNYEVLAEGAADLVKVFSWHGATALLDQPHPFARDPISVTVGSNREWYLGHADLSALPESTYDVITDPDLRAVFTIFYLTRDREHGEGDQGIEGLDAAALAQVVIAGRDSRNTIVRHSVASALLRMGEFEDAGQAFGQLEWSRSASMPGCWEAFDDESPLSEPSRDTKPTVNLFAKGMLSVLLAPPAKEDNMLCDDLYGILSAYLRDALVRHKLHDHFYEMMKVVVDRYQEAGGEPSSAAWFDYGLACHYKGHSSEAAKAYEECLRQEPEHVAASKNLWMVLPPEKRHAVAVERAIHEEPSSAPPASASDLTFKQAWYLLALYRACGGAEQDLILRPFGENEHPFCPTLEMRQPLVSLLHDGIIRISSESPGNAFEVDEATSTVTAYVLDRMFWRLPTATMSLIRQIEDICISRDLPAAWRKSAPALAHELARHECLAYLRACADERHFPMPSGEKTMLMIDNLLSTFSVAQAYAFFWQGAAAAADFKQRERVTAAHAGNTIVGNCQRRADRVRAEGWEVKPYSRPKTVRRSELSYALHDALLGFGERAFTSLLSDLFDGPAELVARRGAQPAM
jgi:tetratricopeptide (TPR) repeat protein